MYAMGPPPAILHSKLMGTLKRETIERAYGSTNSYYYVGKRDVGRHQDVEIVVYPPFGEQFNPAHMLRAAESRYRTLAANPDAIVASAPDELGELFLE